MPADKFCGFLFLGGGGSCCSAGASGQQENLLGEPGWWAQLLVNGWLLGRSQERSQLHLTSPGAWGGRAQELLRVEAVVFLFLSLPFQDQRDMSWMPKLQMSSAGKIPELKESSPLNEASVGPFPLMAANLQVGLGISWI